MVRRTILGRIGIRIWLPVGLLTLALVTLLSWLLYRQAGLSREETSHSYADVLGRLVMISLRDSMQAEDRQGLQREIHRVAELEPIRGIRVVNKRGEVVYSNDESAVGTKIPPEDSTCRACHLPDGTARREGGPLVASDRGTRVTRSIQAIVLEPECVRCHEQPEGSVVGVLVTDLDEEVLTGSLEAGTGHAVWFAFGMSAVVLAVLFLAIRRLIVARVRDLREDLARLRAGARSLNLSGVSRDEIDDLARSLQSFALDVDERVALEHAAATVSRVLGEHPGPVLLMDDSCRVVAANAKAIDRFGSLGSSNPIGRPREELAPDPSGSLGLAREQGWALGGSDESGSVTVAIGDRGGGILGFLEAWPGEEKEDPAGGDDLDRDSDPTPSFGEGGRDWLLYAALLVEDVRAGTVPWRGVLAFDRRLVQGRRLAGQLARAAASIRKRGEVDLHSVVLLALDDARREVRDVSWRTSFESPRKVEGSAHQLRVLAKRLLLAAARQAGPSGYVVAFTQGDRTGAKVFLGAWASSPGGSASLDPAGPPLTRAISRAHGGGIEVDPAFDATKLIEQCGIRLLVDPVGSLYVAEILLEPPE